MIEAKSINLNGLILEGETPITPRTRAFCEQKGIIINQSGGRVTVTGSFSLKKAEVDAFLQSKQFNPSTKECSSVNNQKPDVAAKSFAGMRKGFLI